MRVLRTERSHRAVISDASSNKEISEEELIKLYKKDR
jgi:hypothetical protein